MNESRMSVIALAFIFVMVSYLAAGEPTRLESKIIDIKKSRSDLTRFGVYHHTDLLSIEEALQFRQFYENQIRELHVDILKILSDVNNLAFADAMQLVMVTDIRNDKILNRLCEISEHVPYVSGQHLAILHLGKTRCPQYIPLLSKLTHSEDAHTREASFHALASFGDDISDDVIDLLIGYVDKGSEDQICDAIETLGDLGPVALPAIPSLEKHLDNYDPILAYTILRIVPNHDKAFHHLTTILANDKSATTRCEAAEYLGNLPNSKFSVIAPLSAAFKNDPRKKVRIAALRSLIYVLGTQDEEDIIDIIAENL